MKDTIIIKDIEIGLWDTDNDMYYINSPDKDKLVSGTSLYEALRVLIKEQL